MIEDNPQAKVVIDAGRCIDKVIDLCKISDYIVCSKEFAEDYTKSKNLDDMFNILKRDFSADYFGEKCNNFRIRWLCILR